MTLNESVNKTSIHTKLIRSKVWRSVSYKLIIGKTDNITINCGYFSHVQSLYQLNIFISTRELYWLETGLVIKIQEKQRLELITRHFKCSIYLLDLRQRGIVADLKQNHHPIWHQARHRGGLGWSREPEVVCELLRYRNHGWACYHIITGPTALVPSPFLNTDVQLISWMMASHCSKNKKKELY